MAKREYIGEKFGRWTVLKEAAGIIYKRKNSWIKMTITKTMVVEVFLNVKNGIIWKL